MSSKLSLIALMALGAGSLFAQESKLPVSIGVKVGIPVTELFRANNTGEFNGSLPGNYSSAVPRYEFGVSGEFHLPYGFRFELDGIYKRAGFDSTTPLIGGGSVYRPTTFNDIEIPGLFKKTVGLGHLRPFVEVGASMRHIATISQFTYGLGTLGTIDNNAVELRNRNTFGGVAGFGFTFKRGPFELSPEARYTRWANQTFTAPGLRTNLDQGDVLLGITF